LFKQLYEQLVAKGLMEGMGEKQLKSKIKTIKDVYRHELAKIERSQKSDPGIYRKSIHQNCCGSTQHIFSGKFCLLERVNQIW
jgi:hypothetical protein